MNSTSAFATVLAIALKTNTVITQKKRNRMGPLIVLIIYFQHLISQTCIEQLCQHQGIHSGMLCSWQ
ncbi:conserved hypothetical protein [Alteromonas sp. 38]|nr:conserved hypothetical protein [Alteromonas sp. 154]VXB47670.1 conserved hypothetical protein [Alteromonas sp. 38]